jgi:hypothetical protein
MWGESYVLPGLPAAEPRRLHRNEILSWRAFISCIGQWTCDNGCDAAYSCDVPYTVTTATCGTCYIECDGAYTLCPGTMGAHICDGL